MDEELKLHNVRVLGHDCQDCMLALKADCAATGNPDVGSYAVVRGSWLEAECPHGRSGVWLEEIVIDDDDDHGDSEYDDLSLGNPWEPNLDATKNIGYPAREEGRYGSHPSHDRFDGDSEP